MIEIEVAARRRAGIIAARSLSLEPYTSAFLDWLGVLEKAGPLILKIGLKDRGWAACGRDGDDHVAQEAKLLNSFVREMRAYAYFADTVLRFFTDELTRERLEPALEPDPPNERSLDVLAQARHAFGWNLSMAWSQVTVFRRAWNNDVIDGEALAGVDGQTTIATPSRSPDHPAVATGELPCAPRILIRAPSHRSPPASGPSAQRCGRRPFLPAPDVPLSSYGRRSAGDLFRDRAAPASPTATGAPPRTRSSVCRRPAAARGSPQRQCPAMKRLLGAGPGSPQTPSLRSPGGAVISRVAIVSDAPGDLRGPEPGAAECRSHQQCSHGLDARGRAGDDRCRTAPATRLRVPRPFGGPC
jgi:hypothetical protein